MPHNQAYYKAENKIEQALKSDATQLDLRPSPSFESGIEIPGPMLTELPESIGQLTELRSLSLSNNQLTKLPESIGQLTRLQELYLYNNQLTKLPESIGQLTELQSLSLSDNELTALPESLGQLTQLQRLYLPSNQLTTLPEWIGQFTQLQALDVSNNQLTVLPKSVRALAKLQRLVIFCNKLATLPKEMGFLSQLRSVDLGMNGLTTLPDWMGYFSQLEELLLDNGLARTLKIEGTENGLANKLTNLPSSLFKLEHLRYLDLDNNPLNPELAEAYKQGIDGVKAYLRANATTDKLDESQQKRKLKVFLCHASQDKRIVHELYQKFVAEGWIEPWLDAKKLLPGQDWQAEIKNAVETADNVIIFLSNTSINKDGFIQKELRLAKDIALEKTEGSIFLIPLRLDNCEVPRGLQLYQWANYFGEEKEQTYNNLLESLNLRLKDIQRKEHTGGNHDA